MSLVNTTDSMQYSMARFNETAGYDAIYFIMDKLGATPDLFLGVVPLYKVQHFEIAESQDVLKYRAVEGEFMAHQVGGHMAVKIDLILDGATQDIILFILTNMLYYGKATQEKNSNLNMNSLKIGLPPVSVGATSILNTDVGTLKENEAMIESDDNSYLYTKKLKTFPIWSRGRVLYDMYIETMISTRSIRDGKDITLVHLLSRRFIPPPIVTAVEYMWTSAKKAEEMQSETGRSMYQVKTVLTLKKKVTLQSQRPKNALAIDTLLWAGHLAFMGLYRMKNYGQRATSYGKDSWINQHTKSGSTTAALSSNTTPRYVASNTSNETVTLDASLEEHHYTMAKPADGISYVGVSDIRKGRYEYYLGTTDAFFTSTSRVATLKEGNSLTLKCQGYSEYIVITYSLEQLKIASYNKQMLLIPLLNLKFVPDIGYSFIDWEHGKVKNMAGKWIKKISRIYFSLTDESDGADIAVYSQVAW